ncbi:Segregation and condensation protein A [Alkalibacterium sp. AK22]|uniref:segregation and condensation protein A n=1 Tax=Alkalibacterium sp. AK22 TaxID=1229520 RepID=UPI000449BFD4|nr:segregation/condensation protein A [Alkalibacterium sp. AK22]EXJ24196.1 Segregation and condensation protein A [Alkalibacterium sp. AK22]
MAEDKWKVNLEVFEGPLDLLLHLIAKYEIDIYDIPISEITEQYLKYLQAMQLLKLDVAGEYLIMAATLMSIKSQLLLPRNDEWEEEGESFDIEEDSMERLQERLLEYRKIKYASGRLNEQRADREHYFSKPHSDLAHLQESVPLQVGELSLVNLMDAFADMLQKSSYKEQPPSMIELEETTISDRIHALEGLLSKHKGFLLFSDLFITSSKKECVLTFLAVLEMIKENRLDVRQKESFGEIYLSALNSEGKD